MIRPALDPPPQDLRARWRATRNLRVDPFLSADVARAVQGELRGLPHRLQPPRTDDLQYLMAAWESYPDEGCDHAVCRLTAWWFDAGLRWVEQLIGEPLDAPPDRMMVSTLYGKGCYLDPHNDKAEDRAIAFVLGFTDETWPADEGGWLEFLRFDATTVEVIERRPPGFGTLDLFDVRVPDRIHQIPLLVAHHERRVMSGWFHRPSAAR
jgi:hypothetical protein